MSRTKTMKFKDGKKYPVLIPDFAFNNELDESKFFSFEMESVAIDRNTNNMIVSVNANSPIAGDNGKHPGKTTSTDFLPLNLNNETYLYRDWVPAKVEKAAFQAAFSA